MSFAVPQAAGAARQAISLGWRVAIGASLLIASAVAVAYTVTTPLQFFYWFPSFQGTLPNLYATPQVITRFENLTLSTQGLVTSWAAVNSSDDDDAPTLTWENDPTHPNSRPLIPQSPLQWIVDSNSMRISLTDVPSDIVSAPGGVSLTQSLESNFLTWVDTPLVLPGSRRLVADPRIFTTIVNSSMVLIEHNPSPLAGMTFSYVQNITLSAVTGAIENVQVGPAPGTPFGSATLDGSGKVPVSQLPSIASIGIPVLGGWNASSNVPYLNDSSCAINQDFIYLVTWPGNTTLGGLGGWAEGDKAVCINATWNQIHVMAVTEFNGRTGLVTSQPGDYTAAMVDAAGGGTVADALNAFIVTAFPTPYLPNSNQFSGDGNIQISGFALSLQPKAGFPLASNYVPYFLCNATVDQTGRLNSASSCTAIVSILGTNNRVTVTNVNGYVVLTTPQDTATTSAVTFGSVTTPALILNGKNVTSIGTGTTTIPDVGTADFVMTAGAQTIAGAKSFSSTPVARSDVGVQMNNAANTFSTRVRADPALAANTDFRTPPTSGTAGQILTAVGSGQTQWKSRDRQNVVSTTTASTTSTTFGTMSGMTLTTTNTAANDYMFWFASQGSTSTANVPIEIRILLNGVQVTNQIVRAEQFNAENIAVNMHGIISAVPAGSTILAQVRVVTATTFTYTYRSLMISEF